MSYRRTIITILCCSALFTFGFLYLNTSSPSGKEASLLPTKEVLIRTHKLQHPVSVVLTADKETPISAGEHFNLEVRLTTKKPMKGLKYTWKSTDDSLFVSGDWSGNLNLTTQKTTVLRSQFLSPHAAGSTLHFILSDANGVILSEQFNTASQSQIQHELAEIQKRQSELLNTPDLLLPTPTTKAEQ